MEHVGPLSLRSASLWMKLADVGSMRQTARAG